MRILHVEKFVARHRGGASTYMFDVLERQRSAGHDTEVFGMAHPDNEHVTYGDRFAPRVELSPPPSGLQARARAAARMIWSRPAARAMADVLDDFKPDVIHCHNLYHQLTPSVLGPIAEREIPSVMTVHDFKLVCPTYHLRDNEGRDCTACVGGSPLHAVRKRCEGGSLTGSGVLAVEAVVHRRRQSYGHIQRFLCPSRFMLNQLVAGGIVADRLEHLPNAIEIPPLHRPDLTDPANDSTLALVFAGQLIERKGVDLLIDALADLPAVSLTICGEGPEHQALTKRAAPLGDRVRFAGHLSRSELSTAMQRADALVLPSRGMENQPLSIIEAFARSLPVIGTDTAPIRELVTEGDTGTLFVPNDVVSLRAAITRMLADPAHRRHMAHNARRRAEEQHDVACHLRRLDAIYHEVIR